MANPVLEYRTKTAVPYTIDVANKVSFSVNSPSDDVGVVGDDVVKGGHGEAQLNSPRQVLANT